MTLIAILFWLLVFGAATAALAHTIRSDRGLPPRSHHDDLFVPAKNRLPH